MKTDFIIIGSGIAGLNFALNASKYGKVLIITKKKAVQSSTNKAQGGIAAVLDKTDNIKQHIKDTLIAGAYHNNIKAVEFMVKNGPDAIYKLIKFGVNFAQHNGQLLLTKEGGHNNRRIAFIGDYTGKEIEKTLINNVKANKNITILENTTAIDLLIKNKNCYGVQAINYNNIINIYAKATILATGGIGQIYKTTTNPKISTGDGLAMGIKNNVTTKDLEFIQFHPTVFSKKNHNSFLLSEALRGEGALIINEKGKRFMKNIHKMAELAPRDIVSRAIYNELKKNNVYLDMRALESNKVKTRFPQIYKTLKKYNLDLTKDLIPISPAAHYICGGLITNKNGETCIKNLYAFGEVAYTGVHGANRLASNSLLEALVYSNQISQQIKEVKTIKFPKFSITKKYKKINKKDSNYLYRINKQIKAIMWEKVGIIRQENNLKQSLVMLKKLENNVYKQFQSNITNEKLEETHNLLTVSIAITKSALKRKTSIGAHFILK